MIRKIISIDQEKCNGCGLCIDACHEGALELIDGKAVLISDEYCDGLGDCLPECPTGAIEIIEREAAPFDEELVKERMQSRSAAHTGCPGSRAKVLNQAPLSTRAPQNSTQAEKTEQRPSKLGQWPCQLKLVNPQASYLKNANLLIAADCTAFAHASFHERFMDGRITLIGCPKLDDNNYYIQKLAEIIKLNNPQSIKVVRMEVPCCNGIVRAVKEAMLLAETVVPYSETVLSVQGEILQDI